MAGQRPEVKAALKKAMYGLLQEQFPKVEKEAKAPKAEGKKVAAKYRDEVTGQTWSGRGMKPNWLRAAIVAGATQDQFLIKAE